MVAGSDYEAIERYLVPSALNINLGLIASYRGEVVENPEEAEVVFADNYVAAEGQTVIRSFDIEKLVSIINN